MLRRPGIAAWLCAAALAHGTACEGACGKTHDLGEKVGKRLVSVEQENQLGAQMAAELVREVRLVRDPAVQERIAALGRQLVAASGDVPAGMQLRFAVIDAPDVVNAIALPGGYIFVFSGLLRVAQSEAEVAGVLAHEIAHVVERHVAAQLVTAYGIQSLRELLLGNDRSLIGVAIGDLATRGAFGAFSRTAEREADRLAIRTLIRAGHDPRGYVTFFERLAKGNGRSGAFARFVSSHPDPAERAARARALIRELAPELPVTSAR